MNARMRPVLLSGVRAGATLEGRPSEPTFGRLARDSCLDGCVTPQLN